MEDIYCRSPKYSTCPCMLTMLIAIGIALSAAILAILLIQVPPVDQMGGIQTRLTSQGNTLLPDNNAVVFNELVNDQSSNIGYDTGTGSFTVTRPGNYYVSWWVTTDGSSAFTNVNFSVEINGIPHSMGSSPIVSGQVSGSELITITSVPSTITLVNTSANDLLIANTDVQANMVIVEINS